MIIALFSSSLFSSDLVERLVILGSGPAGLTAAIYAGQAGLKPLVIEKDDCSGQLSAVNHIENFPGFPEGINGNELLERMHLQAEKFGARFHLGTVIDINLTNHPFSLTFNDGHTVYSEAIILALGSSKRWLKLDSEEALKGKGVGFSATCEASLFKNKDVVVVGGGDAALEEAINLAEYAKKVTLIHRSDKLNASLYLQEKISSNSNIQVVLNSAIDDILDVSKGRVTGVALRNLITEEKSVIQCEGVFVSIGRQSDSDLFQGQLEITPSGLISVNSPSTQTSIPGVFAAGDLSDPTYRKAITASGTGCMAALEAIIFLNKSSK